MPVDKNPGTDLDVVSEAVHQRFLFYEMPLDDSASDRLCDAAIQLYEEDCITVDDIATVLIGTFIGIHLTHTNAPTSGAIH